MKQITLILLSFIYLCLAKDWYVSVFEGNDSNPGTRFQPFATFDKAYTSLTDNDTVYLQVGSYKSSQNIKKSMSIIGIPTSGVIPNFAGNVNISSESFSLSRVLVRSTFGIRFSNAGKVTIKDVKTEVEQKAIIANTVKNMIIDEVYVSNGAGVAFQKIDTLDIKTLSLNNMNSYSDFYDIENLRVHNLFAKDLTGTTYPNIHFLRVKNLVLTTAIIESYDNPVTIENSAGIIEHVIIRKWKKENGLRIVGGSNVRATNINLSDGLRAFTCSDATFNMNRGLIANTTAATRSAGECSTGCNFFGLGVKLQNNASPSNCNFNSKKLLKSNKK